MKVPNDEGVSGNALSHSEQRSFASERHPLPPLSLSCHPKTIPPPVPPWAAARQEVDRWLQTRSTPRRTTKWMTLLILLKTRTRKPTSPHKQMRSLRAPGPEPPSFWPASRVRYRRSPCRRMMNQWKSPSCGRSCHLHGTQRVENASFRSPPLDGRRS